VAATKVRPLGKRSFTRTLVAPLGPLFLSVTVKVMVSPTLGLGLLTDLPSCRSAALAFIEVVALLLAGVGSTWSLWSRLAVLPVAAGSVTIATMVRVGIAPTATAPTVHRPVVEV
jgi:hypothetical protein